MKIASLTFIVTDDCNFNCSYCYKRRKKRNLDYSLAKETLSFFIPFINKKYFLSFYGGEPLLEFNLIESIVRFALEKNKEIKKLAKFSITTNGSLITDKILEFFIKHRFHIELSFDGLTQNLSRNQNSFKTVVSNLLKMLKFPKISLETNSVFTPNTVNRLSDSIKYIIQLGVPNIRYSLSTISPWNQEALDSLKIELRKLNEYLSRYYKKYGSIPVVNLRKDNAKGVFFCSAGQNRLAITPEGKIWGCHLFPDYFEEKENSKKFKKYFFGNLNSFTKNHEVIYPKISSNYKKLSMDNFRTSKMECFLCSDLESCSVCPINAAFSSNQIGVVDNYLCEIQKIKHLLTFESHAAFNNT